MLQFNAVVCTATTKFASRLWWRLSIPLTTNAAPIAVKPTRRVNKTKENTSNKGKISSEECMNFNEFKEKLCGSLDTKSLFIPKIQNAKSIQDLVDVTNTTSLLSEKDIIQVKEAIATWAKQREIKESLSHTEKSSEKETKSVKPKIPNEDIISKYCDFSTSRMICEIHKLASNSNRDVQLLKYLFQNILEYNTVLCAGECSNLLYSMSKLSYSDERLINKICTDLLQTNIDSLSITTLLSILKSMGSVRCKHNAFLDKICQFLEKPDVSCDSKHIVTILRSLAMLGYESKHVKNITEKFLPHIKMHTIGPVDWLNYVWSLIVFDAVSADHIKSVLDSNYIERLMNIDPKQQLLHKIKLLNINGYAKSIMKNYSGPFLSNSVQCITKKYSKQKESYLNALETTLKNVLPSPSHFKMRVNTNMGFLLDAELYMDSSFRPIRVDDTENFHIKMGIMVFDYYDLCLSTTEPQGLCKLHQRLLTSNKYEVISIPYHYFGIEDKIEKRVTYLKRQLWKKCMK